MGLDITLDLSSKPVKTPNDLFDLKDSKEIAYFRKRNFIVEEVVNNNNYCLVDEIFYEVSLENLKNLVEKAKIVMKQMKKDRHLGFEAAKKLLPTRGGFFYGPDDYDREEDRDWFIEGFNKVIKLIKIKKIEDYLDTHRSGRIYWYFWW